MKLAENWIGDLGGDLASTPDEIVQQIAALDIPTKAFIDGQYVDAKSGKTFESISPINGKVLAEVAECDREDVDAAVTAARRAFNAGKWANMAPGARKRTLLRFADLIAKHADELALLETLEMGKPISFSRNIDMNGVVETVRWYAEAIDKVYGEIAPTAPNTLDLVTREPMGVVGAVVPWNFPLMMAAWKFAPILAAGNSLVIKPAEQSPLSLLRAVALAAEAGIPEGVFNVLPGYGPTAGAAIGRHMDVDAVAFTGSTEVGKLFLKYAGESNMKSVSLECGGKSPNIVFADSDLSKAIFGAGFGVFFNSGQCCNASTRLIIEESAKDQFLEGLKAFGDGMKPDNPLNPQTKMGTILDDVQTERVMGYIEKGRSEGASIYSGGEQVHRNTGGYYVEPTIFDDVRNEMTIAQEEIFGPVLTTMTFKDMDEAVAIANDSIYGLWASVWTKDIDKAHGVARKLRAGTVNINDTAGGDITVPFGGYKQSGFGRDKSLHALEKYTQLKTTHIKLG
ncbi:MAG: aldehyde dehydrogenase [Alphaproteobacteria bacterium]